MELPAPILAILHRIHAQSPQHGPLLGQLRGEILKMMAEHQQQMSAAPGEMQKLAYQDALTQLPNQALGRLYLEQQLEQARRGQGSLALAVLDVLALRELNTHLGRELTDQFLCKLAQRLEGFVGEGQALIRGQEDEFWLIIWSPETGPQGLNRLISQSRNLLVKIEESMERPLEMGTRSVLAHLSCGVACSQGSESPEVLLDRAHLAVEAARQSGRVYFWQPELEKTRNRRRQLAPLLHQALEKNQFCLRFQPIMKLESLQVQGIECLLRWQNPAEGLVGPDYFLQAACQSGQIVAIGEWVLNQACQLSNLFPLHYICLNVSAQELLQGDFSHRLSKTLSRLKTRPDRVVLEISELHLGLEKPRFLQVVQEVRRWNVQISVDDFSFHGFSLRRLEKLQARFLKLGPEIAQHIEHPTVQGLLKGAVLVAESLGCRVIAEGIETEESMRRLQELGCHWGQGMWLGPLLTRDDLDGALINPPL